jgi:hypothetical protein
MRPRCTDLVAWRFSSSLGGSLPACWKSDSEAACASTSIDDTSWRRVRLPHDFMVERAPSRVRERNRRRESDGVDLTGVNPDANFVASDEQLSPSERRRRADGYLTAGSAWYRIWLPMPPQPLADTTRSTAGLRAQTAYTAAARWLEVDGAARTASIFVNGVLVSRHANGYVPLRHMLPPSTHRSPARTLLAILVDATRPVGWW